MTTQMTIQPERFVEYSPKDFFFVTVRDVGERLRGPRPRAPTTASRTPRRGSPGRWIRAPSPRPRGCPPSRAAPWPGSPSRGSTRAASRSARGRAPPSPTSAAARPSSTNSATTTPSASCSRWISARRRRRLPAASSRAARSRCRRATRRTPRCSADEGGALAVRASADGLVDAVELPRALRRSGSGGKRRARDPRARRARFVVAAADEVLEDLAKAAAPGSARGRRRAGARPDAHAGRVLRAGTPEPPRGDPPARSLRPGDDGGAARHAARADAHTAARRSALTPGPRGFATAAAASGRGRRRPQTAVAHRARADAERRALLNEPAGARRRSAPRQAISARRSRRRGLEPDANGRLAPGSSRSVVGVLRGAGVRRDLEPAPRTRTPARRATPWARGLRWRRSAGGPRSPRPRRAGRRW